MAWGCSNGVSISSWSRRYGKGLHVLGHVREKDSCDVVASIAGRGRITIKTAESRVIIERRSIDLGARIFISSGRGVIGNASLAQELLPPGSPAGPGGGPRRF